MKISFVDSRFMRNIQNQESTMAEESRNEIKIASTLDLIGCAREILDERQKSAWMRCQETKQCFTKKDLTEISSRLLWKLGKGLVLNTKAIEQQFFYLSRLHSIPNES